MIVLIKTPIVGLILLALFCELLLLVIPLIVLYYLTDKDYSQGMVSWADNLLKKFGVTI